MPVCRKRSDGKVGRRLRISSSTKGKSRQSGRDGFDGLGTILIVDRSTAGYATAFYKQKNSGGWWVGTLGWLGIS